MIGNAIPFNDPTLAPIIVNNLNNQLSPAFNLSVNGIPLITYSVAIAKNIPITHQILPPSSLALQSQGTLIHF